MVRQARKYTEEFKQGAVNLAIKSPCIAKVAKELGIPSATLHTWLYQLKMKDTPSLPLKNNPQPDISALLEENRRLQKELAIVKEEKDILKKAAAYFAQHQK